MNQLSQKKQAMAKAKLQEETHTSYTPQNQARAEQMQPEVTATKYNEELTKAKKHLLGYCKVSLLSNVHMNMTLHPRLNPWESVEVTVANLTQGFKENRVLNTANPISVHVNPSELTPQCLAAIKDCQDPQKVKPGEVPPVLTFKWWVVEDLACKRLDAAFGVNFQLGSLLDTTSQHEAEFIEEMRKATKEGDVQGMLSIIQKASMACSF
ncbi:hypothetical protein FRC10_006842 [Ceratobasidium sp. 414]|nr:hypothetical protein FRC10_006842 [Ceratobasidium sp. 414]